MTVEAWREQNQKQFDSIILTGRLLARFSAVRTGDNEVIYSAPLNCSRSESGLTTVFISTSKYDVIKGYSKGDTITVAGKLISFNKKTGDGAYRSINGIDIEAAELTPENEHYNEVKLTGVVVKSPSFVPESGRKIRTSVRVELPNCESRRNRSLIELKFFNYNANIADSLEVGDEVIVHGRFTAKACSHETDEMIQFYTKVLVSSVKVVAGRFEPTDGSDSALWDEYSSLIHFDNKMAETLLFSDGWDKDYKDRTFEQENLVEV